MTTTYSRSLIDAHTSQSPCLRHLPLHALLKISVLLSQPRSDVSVKRILNRVFGHLVTLGCVSLSHLAVLHKLLWQTALYEQNVVSTDAVPDAISDKLVCMMLFEMAQILHEHVARNAHLYYRVDIFDLLQLLLAVVVEVAQPFRFEREYRISLWYLSLNFSSVDWHAQAHLSSSLE